MLWPASYLQTRWPAALDLPCDRRSLWLLARYPLPHPAPEPRQSVPPTYALPGRWGLGLLACFCRHLRESCSSAFPTDCRSAPSSIDMAYRRPDLGHESLIYACSQAFVPSETNCGFSCISDSRSSATATKAGSISIAKQRRPVASAAQRCVPE